MNINIDRAIILLKKRDTLPQILYHLAGIHTKWYYPEMDMLNDAYRNDRKRIIRNEKDYDGVMK
ncbi:hypothetical protein [uncultured Prevotella sp.]|uniref:hypothetical protein n=1 Tax=uncultured Prevotella sp. TaxID=159272 RepID=UPI0026354625|nr:hypothetical protein [uncultured Prevotella sp.]